MPQEYNLEYLDGYERVLEEPTQSTVKSCYSKTDFGLVMVSFCAKRSDGESWRSNFFIPFAILPEGYRPKHEFALGLASLHYDTSVSGFFSEHSALVYVVQADRRGAGEIRCHVPLGQDVKIIAGTLVFYAQ